MQYLSKPLRLAAHSRLLPRPLPWHSPIVLVACRLFIPNRDDRVARHPWQASGNPPATPGAAPATTRARAARAKRVRRVRQHKLLDANPLHRGGVQRPARTASGVQAPRPLPRVREGASMRRFVFALLILFRDARRSRRRCAEAGVPPHPGQVRRDAARSVDQCRAVPAGSGDRQPRLSPQDRAAALIGRNEDRMAGASGNCPRRSPRRSARLQACQALGGAADADPRCR